MAIRNQVQLITYPDSLGGDLSSLYDLFVEHLADLFPGGVHILPPFPSSGDRGFAPRTYFEIEPRFGTWEDIQRIASRVPVLVDLMVNHISRQSPYFQDFAQKGRRSPYAGLFLTLDKIWPGGEPPASDVAKIFLRRPEHPFQDITVAETGEVERVWATFGGRDWSEQIDIDVHAPEARQLLVEILGHMSRQGIRILRLDAIAYVIKKPGTSCFFVEPELYVFLDWIDGEAKKAGIDLLLEVHAHHSLQAKLAGRGYWVYNFVLPLLILHTLQSGDSRALQDHLRTCPRRQFTMLDCHDGIPAQPDLDDVLSVDEVQQVVNTCLQRGANLSRIHSEEHKRRPDFDAHQINITYYSALGDDDVYMAARAIQFFAPGVPQVYYTGLLAGENAPEEVERTGERRAINRRNYTRSEVEEALRKPVVRRLQNLIRFRNSHPAFQGDLEVEPTGAGELHVRWTSGQQACVLQVDLIDGSARITYTDSNGTWFEMTP